MIEIVTAGALTTVQDAGRHGSLRFGVGTAGAMDPLALSAANLLLGNDDDAAAVEIQVFPFRVRFTESGPFALTGADCGATLDGLPLLPWALHHAQAGQELQLGLPLPGAGRTSRAYLALPGGVDVPRVLGSRSTQLRGAFGGFEGRPLRAGDVLRAARRGSAESDHLPFAVMPPMLAMPQQLDGCLAMRVLPAAEHDRYTPETQAAFWAQPWKITPQSDRYGYRFAGETPLVPLAPMEMRSHGIVPGVLQVPPDGQPIVQMRDAQPTGGYPKIGTVIEADLWRLGQAPIGSRIRFVQVTWAQALAALDELEAWQRELARQVQLHRHTKGVA